MVVSWRYANLSTELSWKFCVATARPRTLRGYWWLSDYYSIKKNGISALWSRSGKAGASLLGQDVVASLLSLCMAKWLRKWRRGWLYVRSNTKNAKSLMSLAKLIFQRCVKPFTLVNNLGNWLFLMGIFSLLKKKNSIILIAFFFYFSTCFHVRTNNLIIWP